MDIVTFLSSYMSAHPKVLAAIVTVLVVHTALKAFVDSLVSSRAEWDKTPLEDNTPVEKALTWAVRILGVTGKAMAYLAGFRAQKPPTP